MSLSPPDADTIFAQLLQDLPADLQETARQFKAFTRARKIRSAAQLLRAVLLFAGLDMSEREVAANLLLVDPQIRRLSDQAVHQRLRSCEPWLRALLPCLLRRRALPALPPGVRLLVVDATQLAAPGQRRATHRLHIVMDLISLQLVEVRVSDYKTGETLRNFSFQSGDVVVCDRGYSKQQSLEVVLAAGGEAIIRYNAANFPLQNEAGQPLQIARELAAVEPGETLTLAAQFVTRAGEVRQVWVHVYRLQGVAAEAARRRCLRAGQRAGYKPRQETLLLAEFVLVLSSVAPEYLAAATVLACYSCRWQVELLIKKWKSLLALDQLRARAGSVLAMVWLQGKLLYAALLERRLRRLCPGQWTDLTQQRPGTHWRYWKLVQREVEPLITLSQCWRVEAWEAAAQALAERPRRRRLQRLPQEFVVWLRDAAPNRTRQPREALT